MFNLKSGVSQLDRRLSNIYTICHTCVTEFQGVKSELVYGWERLRVCHFRYESKCRAVKEDYITSGMEGYIREHIRLATCVTQV